MTVSKTLVINLFAGPGAGKTTCAWAIASKLKMLHINTEYVSEYAKELVWDEKLEELKDQMKVSTVQHNRLKRLYDKVDVIVTDSPVLLGLYYGEDKLSEKQRATISSWHKEVESFNLFIKRGNYYEQAGRLEDKQTAEEIDANIRRILFNEKVYYGEYNQNRLDTITNNIMTTLRRLNPECVKNALDSLQQKEYYSDIKAKGASRSIGEELV